MAKGLHGKPPERQSSGVAGVLLVAALVIVVVANIGAAHGFQNLADMLPWSRH